MYTIVIFEQAMNSCGYQLNRVKYMPESRNIRKIEGRVPIAKKVIIDGIRKNVIRHKRCRWDAVGHCFSYTSNKRLPQYDLPLRTIIELNKNREALPLPD